MTSLFDDVTASAALEYVRTLIRGGDRPIDVALALEQAASPFIIDPGVAREAWQLLGGALPEVERAIVEYFGDHDWSTGDGRDWSEPSDSEPGELVAARAVDVEPEVDETWLPPDVDEFLAGTDPEHDWVIPAIAEAGDRIVITGGEGLGKSTLLRQIAVQAAAGIHPFTGQPIPPLRVLLIDCENSARHVRRKLRPLRELVGPLERGALRIHIVGHSIDLAHQPTYNAVASRVNLHRPHLIVIGPLYKMTGGDPRLEEPARALADALDQLRAIAGSALLIEAHTPYAEGAKTRRPIRPYGASIWSRWPEFGIYLAADGRLEHWRGQRDERSWPTALRRSEPWPWVVSDAPERKPWDGPTACMATIEAWFRDNPDAEVSKSALPLKLRVAGAHYRDRVVAEALEHLASQGRVHHRKGPRKADLYRLPTAQDTT